MEGLPFDFGIEDDSEDGADKKDSKSTSKSSKITLGKEIIDLLASEPKKIEPKPEKVESGGELLGTDNNPELDTEAPVERLSIVESEAISQTLATERLGDLHAESVGELSLDDDAAEGFLENVEINGEVDEAFNLALSEIGVDPTNYEVPPANEEIIDIPLEQSSDQPIPIDPSSVIQIHQTESAPTTEEAASEQPAPRTESSYRIPAAPETPKSSLDNIVNYLVSRREPRIKTPKDVEPVRNRLEQEVIELKIKLQNKESQIRRVAKSRAKTEVLKASGKVTTKEARRESQETIKRNIGKVAEQTKIQPELSNLKAQTMTRVELLTLASKIDIDGTNLRQVYEAHLLGERGLRRVIAIYLRGGNVKRSLRRELVEKEIDFERDPSLRDQASDAPMSGATASIEQLLEKSGINWSDQEPDEQPDKIDISNIVDTKPSDKKKPRTIKQISDLLLLGLILILVVIILALLINR
jgi:hypothetical protein